MNKIIKISNFCLNLSNEIIESPITLYRYVLRKEESTYYLIFSMAVTFILIITMNQALNTESTIYSLLNYSYSLVAIILIIGAASKYVISKYDPIIDEIEYVSLEAKKNVIPNLKSDFNTTIDHFKSNKNDTCVIENTIVSTRLEQDDEVNIGNIDFLELIKIPEAIEKPIISTGPNHKGILYFAVKYRIIQEFYPKMKLDTDKFKYQKDFLLYVGEIENINPGSLKTHYTKIKYDSLIDIEKKNSDLISIMSKTDEFKNYPLAKKYANSLLSE